MPITKVVEGVMTKMSITTAEEKAQRRLEASKACESVGAFGGKAFIRRSNLDTMSMDDLYSNLKVYEPEVKGMSSLNSNTQNMAFVSSSNNNTSSTNGAVNTAQAVNTAHGVSIVSTQVNSAYSTDIDNLSDSDRADEGPNYALNAFSSLSSDSKPVVENCKAKSSEEDPKVVRKNDDALITEEWVLDHEKDDLSEPKIEEK
uniref:Uncharacterized protein n=1 Tax=Tanacetum cinerariifolium TaxID=118510 RepID=A0A6L2P855_TANCI|nr:hypothetical protein [Tanacetum cinerariifolium]